MNEINFYSKSKKFGWLSNFYFSNQILFFRNGKRRLFKTNEHYCQSQKAKEHSLEVWIADSPSPYSAMKAGRSLRKEDMIDNWDLLRTDVMKCGLRAKFYQNKELTDLLISTGDYILHENSPTDMFWGKKGKDMLGKLIMEVRQELKEDKNVIP